MPPLPALLLVSWLCCRASPAAPQVPGTAAVVSAESPTFRLLQVSSFANGSWARSQGSGWLGTLQTHAWDSALSTIRYLEPWSRGNVSEQQLKSFQALLRLYFHGFPQAVRDFATQMQFEYPFVLQISLGCRARAGEPWESFLHGAYNGQDLVSFQGGSWRPSPGAGTRAQHVCGVLNQYRSIREILQHLGRSCPPFLAGLLEAGKSQLQRQERPEAWLSPGPSPGPGRLLLVCHVSGFYPEPLWATWVRGDQEQPGSRRGDTLPLADGTWYLRVTLDVAAGEAAGLACRVKHSSLGGRDIVLPWDGHPLLLLLVCLSVPAALATLVVIHTWVTEHRWTRNVLCLHAAKSVFVPGASSPGHRVSEHQPSGAQRLRGKKRPWQRWREILHQLCGQFIAPKVLPASPSTHNSCKMHGQAG